MINVTRPGPIIVLIILLIMTIAAFVFVFTGRLENKITVTAHCDGAISLDRIRAYFKEQLNLEDDNTYRVLFSYLEQLDDSGNYVLFDTVMSEEKYLKSGITTGARVRFENGLEGIVISGTTAGGYDELYGEFFKYTDNELFQMDVYPGQEPYYMSYIFTGQTAEDPAGEMFSCDIVTQSVTLSNVLFGRTDE